MTVEIGSYRVEHEVARGANGVVLRAQGPQGPVAIKLLLPERLEDPEDVTRFHREGEVAARLNHPGIVPLLDRGEGSHGPYHVYAYVSGQSLSELIHDEGRLDPQRAAKITLQLASALQHAHEHDVLHRDLKPANVLMDPGGAPHLTDFGLAQDGHSASRLTLSGEIMGSPVFMPPEQAQGKRNDIGPASDVYGLGAILYTSLTGNPPVTGEGVEEVLQRVIRTPVVSPATVVPSVPAQLAAVCMRCLEKHPGDRYPNMRALAADLKHFLSPRPQATPPSRNTVLALAGAGLLAVLGLTGLAIVAGQRLLRPAANAQPAQNAALDPQPSAWPTPEPEDEVGVDDLLREAENALARHKGKAAEVAARAALELDPECAAAYLQLGRALDDRGDRTAAFEAWARAKALGSSDVDHLLAELYPNPTLRRLMWITLLPEEGELAEAALLCTKYIDSPELDVAEVLERLDEIADTLRPKLEGLSGLERFKRLAQLSERQVVGGNLREYSDPDNSSLAKALESKQGIHITCTLVLIALGKRLEVEVAGVCFPGPFLARVPTEPPTFYNAYQSMYVATKDLPRLYDKNTDDLEFIPSVLAPSTRQEILVRLVVFQAGTYSARGSDELSQRGLELEHELVLGDPRIRKRAFGEH